MNNLGNLGLKKLLLLLLVVFLIITSPALQALAAATSTPATVEPDYSRYGGTLTVAIGSVSTLDSQLATDLDSRQVIANIQEGLYGFDEKGVLIPLLATSFPQPLDEVTFIIPLREGVQFHDGTSFDAEDVVYTVNRLLSPKTNAPTRRLFTNISSVVAVNDHTVKVQLRSPDTKVASLFAAMELYPLSAESLTRYGENYGKVIAIGTGPFQFAEWQQGEQLLLNQNQFYWQPGFPYLKMVVFQLRPEEETRWGTLRARKISVVPNLSPQLAAEAQKTWRIRLLHNPGTIIEQLYLNTDRSPFNNRLVRQALAYAIDRKALAKEVFAGYATVANTPVPPSYKPHNSNLKYFSYQPETAMRLLAEAGYTWSKPLAFKLWCTDKEKFIRQAELIKDQLDQIGVTVTVTPMKKQTLFDYLYDRKPRQQFQAALEDWQGGTLPHRFLYDLYYSKSPYNKVRFKNPMVDQLLTDIVSTWQEEANSLFLQQLEQIITEDASTIYLLFPHTICAYNYYVKGLSLNSAGIIRLNKTWLKRRR